jgi:hypothetical protein
MKGSSGCRAEWPLHPSFNKRTLTRTLTNDADAPISGPLGGTARG